MARLQKLGEHWHRKLWEGSGAWEGDRFLNIYHHPLKDEIEVRYEIPNEKPQLVFQIPLADFDIDKLCAALAKADNRKTSVQDKIREVDAHNDALRIEAEKAEQAKKDEMTEKMLWAMRKDTGHHVAPLTVPDSDVVS